MQIMPNLDENSTKYRQFYVIQSILAVSTYLPAEI
jgi:hypothetical protein